MITTVSATYGTGLPVQTKTTQPPPASQYPNPNNSNFLTRDFFSGMEAQQEENPRPQQHHKQDNKETPQTRNHGSHLQHEHHYFPQVLSKPIKSS